MFDSGNFWGAFIRIVLRRAASAAALTVFGALAGITFAVTLFALPAPAAAETVDDLFLFFAHEWTYEKRMSNLDKGGESLRDVIIAAEPRFGGLAEYWELRALYDVAEPKLTPGEQRAYIFHNESGEPYVEYYVNMDCLRKAVEVNPKRAPAIAYIGQKEQEAVYALAGDVAPADVEMEYRIPPEADLIYADALAAAARADQDNGWYPMMRGAILMHLGEWDEAIEKFKAAGQCRDYSTGRLFPFDFASKLFLGNESVTYALAGLTLHERYTFLSGVAFPGGFPSMNYIRIKDAFQEAAVGVAMGKNPEEVYTALNKAACVMGAGENCDLIDRLAASVLVNFCAGKALEAMPGKPGLKDARLAVDVELDTIKTVTKLSNNSTFNRNLSLFIRLYKYAETGSADIDEDFKEYVEKADEILSNREPESTEDEQSAELSRMQEIAFLAFFHNDEFFVEDKFAADSAIRPAFERLKGLDYSNPGEWYEYWLAEKRFVREEDVGG